MCTLFKPDAAYWNESDYQNRGYYSYWMDIGNYSDGTERKPENIIEETIIEHLLPKVNSMLAENNVTDKVIGAEWWCHTRPIGANLGHQLHFDTDEAFLEQKKEITHPIVSSVLYLSTGSNSEKAGSTIIFNQNPHSSSYADYAFVSCPENNSFMLFPGNLLHGVPPCQTSKETNGRNSFEKSKKDSSINHRLTFMVGFWTRNVPENIKRRGLYSACGPMPPQSDEHTWVAEAKSLCTGDNPITEGIEVQSLQLVEPASQSIEYNNTNLENKPLCDLPEGINHRYFIREEKGEGGNNPRFFYDTLFQN